MVKKSLSFASRNQHLKKEKKMKKKQNSIEHDGVKTINVNKVLSKEQFKELYTFVNIIKPHYLDFCIVNGQFRSRSNDNTNIIEAKFSYFRDINFNITDTKLLVQMLSTLDKKADITITIDDTNVTFTDGYQSLKIAKANDKFIDNRFIADEEIKEIISEIDADKPFIKEALPKAVVFNINKMTRELHTNGVSVRHVEGDLNKGYLYISNNNNERKYTIKLRKDFLAPMEKDSYLNVSTLPFIFNKADMTLNWDINKERSIILTMYNTRVDGLFINIFGRAAFIKKDE